jgi:hypothetical protein
LPKISAAAVRARRLLADAGYAEGFELMPTGDAGTSQ